MNNTEKLNFNFSKGLYDISNHYQYCHLRNKMAFLNKLYIASNCVTGVIGTMPLLSLLKNELDKDFICPTCVDKYELVKSSVGMTSNIYIAGLGMKFIYDELKNVPKEAVYKLPKKEFLSFLSRGTGSFAISAMICTNLVLTPYYYKHFTHSLRCLQ
uniref:Uncharacterized protein n=1 Tax=viral metagenome TaxID=1070528 RepID=A0A6C0EBS2_9ZZZZ